MRCTSLLVGSILLSALLTLVPAEPVCGCYAIIVGRLASADGSVLVGHNEQNYGRRIINFRRVPRRQYPNGAVVTLRRGGTLPQVGETWSFLWSENPGLENSDAYFNEWGVCVVSDGCPTREDDYDTLVKRGAIRAGGIGYMFRRLIAERARTARQGVQIARQLIERFGYYDSGRTYVIADPNEAWLFATVRGRHWVAQRVPDDAVVVLPNVHIIAQVDLNDTDNFLAAPDLIQYATKRGWYDPSSGVPFSFRQAFNQDRSDPPDIRRWRGRNLVSGAAVPWPPRTPPPVGIKPKQKMTVASVAAILRDTQTPRPLSNPVTQEGVVFQLRRGMPEAIGCVAWRATAEPATSVLTPWYAGITATPRNYYREVDVETQLSLEHHFAPPRGTFAPDLHLAWWKFRTLQDLVHQDYARRSATVRAAWASFEQATFASQPSVEKKALELWKTDPDAARAYLTKYCADVAARAGRKADALSASFRD